jgi:CO/xanthine dehydrogenase Mo-binding subunit
LAQIAAEALGVPMEDVTVFHGDSALTPLAGTTTATRQLYMSGNATLKAAATVRRNLLEKAGRMLGMDPSYLDIKDRQVFIQPERKPWMVVENDSRECTISYGGDRGDIIISEVCGSNDPDTTIPLTEVIKAAAADGIELLCVAQFNAPARELLDFKTGQGQVFPDFTFGTIAMEVAVDIDTGDVDVLKMISCFDVGQTINPLSVEGQMEGGAVYGLGYGLCEEVILDKGITLTPSLAEYLIPTSKDVPQVETIMIQSGGGIGPFGAKGIGEPANVPPPPALANAVCDAIGARVYDLPITPEKILKALKAI